MVINKNKSKRIIFDVLLNMVATFIPMFILQFLILPRIASRINSDSYGLLLTLIAFIYLSASTFGSVLNNARLIHYKEYKENNIDGDFSVILVYFVISNIFIIIFGLLFYGQSVTISLLLLSVLLLLNSYASVEFRINLNFKYILMNNIWLSLGYVIGYLLFVITGYWSLIYLCGFGLNFIFIIKRTKILKEKLKKSKLFRITTKEVIILLFSGFLVSLSTYIDKLIIFPLLGGAAVSIYYTSTILGKTIAIAIGPITGVLLSYLAHMKRFSIDDFKLLLIISSVVGFVGYWVVIIVSKPLLTIIYPQYVEQCLRYIYITTLSIIITIVCNVINSVLLKFSGAKWQLIINGIYMITYLSVSLLLLDLYGLMGFCVGILIANIVKLVIMVATYFYLNKDNNVNNISEEY